MDTLHCDRSAPENPHSLTRNRTTPWISSGSVALEVVPQLAGGTAVLPACQMGGVSRSGVVPEAVRAYHGGWEEPRMVKLVYCIHRRSDVEVEAFRKYWRENHAPKVARVAEALHARRYVQSHTVDSDLNAALRDSRGASPPYDGITEIWWDSEEVLEEAMRTDEGAEAGRLLLEDEQHFIDLKASSLFLTHEHEIF